MLERGNMSKFKRRYLKLYIFKKIFYKVGKTVKNTGQTEKVEF